MIRRIQREHDLGHTSQTSLTSRFKSVSHFPGDMPHSSVRRFYRGLRNWTIDVDGLHRVDIPQRSLFGQLRPTELYCYHFIHAFNAHFSGRSENWVQGLQNE